MNCENAKSKFVLLLRCLAIRLALIITMAMLLVGCAGSKTNVVKSANPNPFQHQKEFVVEPVRYVDLVVDEKPEKEFLAGKNAESLASWAADKKAVDEVFRKTVIEEAGRAGITVRHPGSAAYCAIRPTIKWVETGYYRIPAWNAVTRIK